MALCYTVIRLVCADQAEYDLWKAQLQDAVQNKGFVVIEESPETFTYAIQHEDNL